MIKKILIVGPAESYLCPPIVKTLRNLGYECDFFNYRSGLIYTNRFIKTLIHGVPAGKYFKSKVKIKINRQLLKNVEDNKSDLVLVSEGENISPDTIFSIRRKGVLTANWFTDFISHWHIIEKIAPAYNYFFTPDNYVLEKLKKNGLDNCFYLPFAVEKISEGSPFDQRINTYSISLVASYNPNIWKKRDEFLIAVGSLGLNIWGPKVWLKSPLKDYYRGQADSKKTLEIYRQSKIVTDIPWDNYPADGISMRPTEAMISGACLFMYDIRSDMSKLFKRNTDYIPFLSAEELKTKASYYLDNEIERNKIARNGYQATLLSYTYKTILEKMLAIINNSPTT